MPFAIIRIVRGSSWRGLDNPCSPTSISLSGPAGSSIIATTYLHTAVRLEL